MARSLVVGRELSEMEVEESAEGKESGPKGAAPGPGQADSDLYEYEGDDVYFTNPTTKGTVV